MFSGKSILKVIIIAFIIFALLKNKLQTVQLPEKETSKFEFLKDVRSSLEVLTADPKRNNINDNTPILPVNYGEDNPPNPPQTSPANNKIKPNNNNSQPNTPNQQTWLEQKILNAADNILHSSQGQELLEKFLLNREQVPEHINKSNVKKDPHHNNSIIEITEGSGLPAQCGDIVSAHYVTRLVNGKEIENTNFLDKPLTFQVGNHQVIKGLEYAILGMKEGGKRRLVIPPKMAYNRKQFSKGLVADNEFVTIDVELINIDPVYHGLDNQIRIFDNSSMLHDFPIMCSDPVFFNYTITTLDNKLIAKSENPVSFIFGSASVPPAINKAFSGIKFNTKRSVIMPSSLIYNKKISFLPNNVKLPKNELILIEIDTD